MNNNGNNEAQGGQNQTITERYMDEVEFMELLERIGVSATARNKVIDDDFINMKSSMIQIAHASHEIPPYLRMSSLTQLTLSS